jgi:hypothetical protein
MNLLAFAKISIFGVKKTTGKNVLIELEKVQKGCYFTYFKLKTNKGKLLYNLSFELKIEDIKNQFLDIEFDNHG